MIDVTAITMRRNAIFTAILGRPATERVQRHFAHLPGNDAVQFSSLQLRHAGSYGSGLSRDGRRLELVGDSDEEKPSE